MAAKSSAARILFIDDDEDLVSALSIMLKSEGYEVRHALNGDEGVRMATEDPPDLIIMDFMMPVKNGFEACCELRQIKQLKKVPILAFTAFGQDIGEIYGLGQDQDGPPHVQEYLEKPVEPNVLLERVASALAN